MYLNKSFIDKMAKPVFVLDFDGSIIHINEHGYLLLHRALRKNDVHNITEIDPCFCIDYNIGTAYTRRNIHIKKLKFYIDIFEFRYEDHKNALIYIFDNILFNCEIVKLFNHIGDAINITNSKGVIETCNDAVYRLTKFIPSDGNVDPGTGTSLIDLYEKEKIVTEPAYISVIKEKKPIIKRVTYESGTTLLNRGYPVFNDNGEIERVIIFSQNVSELSAMEEKLILSEKNQNNYMKINEITEYFDIHDLIFSSDSMKKVVNIAIKTASSDSSVFITGETGVGKDVIARMIHNLSGRKNKNFIAINCATIPTELFESELFGYEQGAFTGAQRFGKKGLLEQANGGTVFLDELGEMPNAMQSKLLRVIQENKIRRVGGTEDISINVRYISATNLNFEQLLNKNYLRRDLYYRLSVVPINIPPLRQRREDIIPLIQHFLEYYNKNQGKSVFLSKDLVRKLISYNWPGNVRELKNTLERIVVLAEGNLAEDIDFFENGSGLVYGIDNQEDIIIRNIIPIKSAYNIVDNILVKMAYSETKSIVKAARMLGIDPSTIHRKINMGELQL